MKTVKRIALLLVAILLMAFIYNYPKLNILAGYAAKNTASSVFLANRTLQYTNSIDNNFSPINTTRNTINKKERSATSSVFNIFSRKAIYREGLGAVLITDDYKTNTQPLVPKRSVPKYTKAYPFGNAPHKDSVFTHVNYTKIEKVVAKLFEEKNQTRALVILHKNKIIAEKYAPNITKNSKLLGWSMTKSITGTIIGILQHQGKLNVFDKAPITAWQNDIRKNISIHNLLQMNSGLEWNEDYNSISDVTKMLFLEKDMTLSQAIKEPIAKPNTKWIYSSGTSNLLSGIIRGKFNNHQEYLDFWYSNLIDKISMNSMTIETDMSGNYISSSYAWATARDWAKLGLLYLQNGNWNGEQIFSKDWVKYATTPTPTSQIKEEGGYGAHIWLNTAKKYPDAPTNMYSFNGYKGQNVFILPDEDLVIVRLSLSKNADINNFIKEIINATKS